MAKESTRTLAGRDGLNAKTVAKWRKRTTTVDQPMGPSKPKSTVLTEIEEAIVVAFRRRTLLPLDDVLGGLRETIPSCPAALSTVALLAMGFRDCPGARRPLPSVDASPRRRSTMSISRASSFARAARSICRRWALPRPSSSPGGSKIATHVA